MIDPVYQAARAVVDAQRGSSLRQGLAMNALRDALAAADAKDFVAGSTIHEHEPLLTPYGDER